MTQRSRSRRRGGSSVRGRRRKRFALERRRRRSWRRRGRVRVGVGSSFRMKWNEETPVRVRGGLVFLGMGRDEGVGGYPCMLCVEFPHLGRRCATTISSRGGRGRESQQPAKKQVRKSKKSWEFVTASRLKSALLAKKSVRKSKKSCELTQPMSFQLQG